MNLASTKKIWDIDETSNNNATSTNNGTNSSLNNHSTSNQKQNTNNKDDGQISSTNGSLNSSNVVSQSQTQDSQTGDPLFLSDSQWRNEPGTWATVPNVNTTDHAVSQPIMMQRSGSFPGLELSPRSGGEPGGLGLKMVEYLLDSSPTTKDIDLRMSRLGLNDNVNSNNLTNNLDNSGIVTNKKKLDKESLDGSTTNGNLIQNGLTNGTNPAVCNSNGVLDDLDDNKSFNKTPGGSNSLVTNDAIMNGNNGLVDDQVNKLVVKNNISHSSAHLTQNNLSDQMNNINGDGFNSVQNQLAANMFQNYGSDFDNPFGTGMDSIPFDYQMAMDSASGILDYSNAAVNSQLYGQRNQQTTQPQQTTQQLLAQQYAAAQQNQTQQQNLFPQNPYYQDQFAAQMGHMIPAGPQPMMQPYYGLPAPHWSNVMYPHHPAQLITAQQRNGRPLTPSQSVTGDQQNVVSSGAPVQMGTQNTQQNNGQQQFSMLPSQGYYDQNGLLTNTANNNRAPAQQPMRIMAPQMLPTGPNNNQPNNLRMNQPGSSATGQAGLLFGQPNNNYNTNGNQLTNYHNTNALNNGQLSASFSNPAGQQMQPGAPNQYNNNVLNSLSASLAPTGPSLSQANSPRRESFDRRQDQTMFGNGSLFSNGMDYRHLSSTKNSYYGILPGAQTPPPQQQFNNASNPLSNVIGMNPANGNSNGSNRMISAAPGAEAKNYMRNGPLSSNMFGANSLFHNNNLGFVGNQTNNLNTLTAMPMTNANHNVAVGSLINANNANGLVGSNSVVSASNSSISATGVRATNNQVPQLQRSGSVDKSATGRSKLLEDFRNNRYSNLQLRDLTNHIVEFSQDQHGSRFIQQKLERASAAEKQLVFNEIISSAYNLMTDVFGNYVIQKFFEFGTPEQKQTLAMKVKGHVLPLALQMYGCRVIQKALESIPPEQKQMFQKDIVMELEGHVLKCVKDQNGNHVVQKCIECVDPHALQFIIGAFSNQVYALSTHPYGCRVIQRILEHCTPDQTTAILDELHSSTEQLVQDQYGNYVIQHVLEHGRPEDKSKIINNVRGKVLTLSQHKFASNVVEKCVTHASRQERAMLIEEVCAYDSTHGALYTMMKDQYANYVIQKMIEIAEPPQKKLLIQRIKPHLPVLRKYTYGKHIIAKLEKYMMLKPSEISAIGASNNGGNTVI